MYQSISVSKIKEKVLCLIEEKWNNEVFEFLRIYTRLQHIKIDEETPHLKFDVTFNPFVFQILSFYYFRYFTVSETKMVRP